MSLQDATERMFERNKGEILEEAETPVRANQEVERGVLVLKVQETIPPGVASCALLGVFSFVM